VERITFVSALVTVTAAFGATAPLWSFTSPVMEPEVCASEANGRNSAIANREFFIVFLQETAPYGQGSEGSGSKF